MTQKVQSNVVCAAAGGDSASGSGPRGALRFAVLIHTRCEIHTLADIAWAMAHRGIIPEQFRSVRHGDEMEVRLVLDCDQPGANAFRYHCESILKVSSFLLAPVNGVSPA